MADKQISDLVQATEIQPPDLFVLEQSGTAKKLTGQTLVNWMTSYADGHGGIQSITWQTSGTSGNGPLHSATIHYADGTTSTFDIRDGYKGDTGAAWYVWIKYAAHQPTQNSDMGDAMDNWMGIYSGTSSTAPTSYTSYSWFEIKGNTGDPSVLTNSEVVYQQGTTGTAPPQGQWSASIPIVSPGNWLWTKITLTFNTGVPVTVYSAARQGINGDGSPSDEIPLVGVTGGSAGTSTDFSRADHRHPLNSLHLSGTISSLPYTFSDASIFSNMRVLNIVFDPPSNVRSDIAWETQDGSIQLSGNLSGSTAVDVDLAAF